MQGCWVGIVLILDGIAFQEEAAPKANHRSGWRGVCQGLVVFGGVEPTAQMFLKRSTELATR